MAVERVGIVGAGTMGRGIAQICAVSGMDVVVSDVSRAQLDDARAAMEANYTRMVDRDRMSDQARSEAMARLTLEDNLEALAGVELVIEAATETPEVKTPLLEKIADACGADTVLASNTSSI